MTYRLSGWVSRSIRVLSYARSKAPPFRAGLITSLALAAGQDAMAWRYFTVLDWQIRVRRLAVSKEMEWTL